MSSSLEQPQTWTAPKDCKNRAPCPMLGCKHKTLLLIHIDPPVFFSQQTFQHVSTFLGPGCPSTNRSGHRLQELEQAPGASQRHGFFIKDHNRAQGPLRAHQERASGAHEPLYKDGFGIERHVTGKGPDQKGWIDRKVSESDYSGSTILAHA